MDRGVKKIHKEVNPIQSIERGSKVSPSFPCLPKDGWKVVVLVVVVVVVVVVVTFIHMA